MNRSKPVFVAVAALSLLAVACKINKDANCLNPKAGCYNKDTEAPSVVNTNPTSQPTNAINSVNGLSNFIIYFSEPMKNAADKSSYPNPTGSGAGAGGTALQISSITKFDDKTYQVNLTGTAVGGPIVFDLGALTDLSGNTLTNPTVTYQNQGITLTPSTGWVGTGGYTSVNLKWTNTAAYAVDWIIKKNGSNCSTASAVSNASPAGNTLQSGANALAANTGQPNLGNGIDIALAEFPAAPSVTTIRVCMTNAAQNLDIQFSVDITRDDTAPTMNTISPVSGRCDLPYAMTITCSDNADKIVYSYDTTGTGLVPTTPAFNMTTGAITAGTPYDTTNGFSLNTKGSVQFKYLCIDKAGHLNTGSVITTTCQSTVKWDSSVWSAAGPSQPYDVWK